MLANGCCRCCVAWDIFILSWSDPYDAAGMTKLSVAIYLVIKSVIPVSSTPLKAARVSTVLGRWCYPQQLVWLVSLLLVTCVTWPTVLPLASLQLAIMSRLVHRLLWLLSLCKLRGDHGRLRLLSYKGCENVHLFLDVLPPPPLPFYRSVMPFLLL